MSGTNRRGFLRGALALPAVAAVPTIAQSSPAIGDGKAIFMIDGESVLIDVTDTSMGDGCLAVVLDADDKFKVMEVVNNNDDAYAIRQRAGYGPWYPAPEYGRRARTRENVRIIGKVIDPVPLVRLTA